MTTYLSKERLLSALESDIAALAGAGGSVRDRAEAYARVKRAIDAGEFDIEGPELARPQFDEPATQQDPLELAADRIEGSSAVTDIVRGLAVGDVVSVQTILYRRADEHEKQATIIRERRAMMTEALQGLLSPEAKEEAPMERELGEPFRQSSSPLRPGDYITRNDRYGR